MTGAFGSWVMGLVGAALLSAIAGALTPEGKVKAVTRLVCAAVTALALVSPAVKFDTSAYSKTLTLYRERERELTAEVSEKGGRLSRSIIESECEAYILDKAGNLGSPVRSAHVTAKWSGDGFWYPYEVRIESDGRAEADAELSYGIEVNLGIPKERQEWDYGN